MSTLRPAGADGTHHVAQDERHLGPVRRLARPQDHRHRLAGRGLVDVDRQEAPLVMAGVEQRELLPAMHRVAGVVDVEHDPPRDFLEAVAEQLDHGGHHPLQGGGAGQVLQPGHGRLRAQVLVALGQAPDRHLEARVDAQRAAVVGVRVAGRDQQRAEADHLRQGVADPLRCARVGEAAGQALGDAEPALDLGQHQHPGVRGHAATVEGDVNRLAADR
jgi:hypothetical protein